MKLRILAPVILALSYLVAAAPAFARPSGRTTTHDGCEVSADSVIVDLLPGASVEQIAALARVAGVREATVSLRSGRRVRPEALRSSGTLPALSHAVLVFDPGVDVPEMIRRARALPGVRDAYPNHVFHPLYRPNDPGYVLQQNFRQIYVDLAWDVTWGAGAKVGVIDTGYRTAGMSDSALNLDPGYDFWGEDEDTTDFIGHGTHVANTVAEATDNGVGMAGIAYQAEILVLKVFPDYDQGAFEGDIIDAINYGVDEGAQVLNMSLGGAGSNPVTARALENALAAGTIPVCASGNDGLPYVSYPAGHESCVAVGSVNLHATGQAGERSGFSSYGDALDLVAPGESIIQETFYPGIGVGPIPFWGTSSAAPHVAGVVALLAGQVGRVEVDTLLESLFSTAQDIPPAGWDTFTGWGEVNAQAALDHYMQNVNQLPTADFTAASAGPLTVAFDGSPSVDPDGQIALYEWDLGDGTDVQTGQQIEHVYDAAGQYRVRLRVTDDRGGQAMATRTLVIEEPEEPATGDDDDGGCGC